MSDTGFIDIGDELVLRISGYPVARGSVTEVDSNGALVEFTDDSGEKVMFNVPLNVHEYDTVDGYAHHSQPLAGVAG
jgi:hypothetical protein